MCRSRSAGIQTMGSRSAFSHLASITASTLSDFNRAAAIALVRVGWESTTSWPNRRAVSTNHHQEPVDSTAMVVPVGSWVRVHYMSFQLVENYIPRGIFPIPPAPAFLDQRVVDVRSVR